MNSIIYSDAIEIVKKTDFGLLKGKQVLLTGSNGLFGRYIASVISLLNQKYKYKTTLYCISRNEPNTDISDLMKNDANIHSSAADLSKPFSFNKKVDYIFHAACYAQPQKFLENKFETVELNVSTTRTLLEIAKKHKARFLFFSSAEVYGDIPKDMIPVPETYTGNIDTSSVRAIYSESKRLGETLCAVYRREENVETFIARISHVYGPGISIADKRVLGEFIKKAFIDKQIILQDSGTAVKTWGYIADIVQMLFSVVLHGKELVYNIGGIDTVSIKELAREIGMQTGVPVQVPKVIVQKRHIATDPQFVKLDIGKYSKEFGKPKFVEFSEGIKRTLLWNRELDFPTKT